MLSHIIAEFKHVLGNPFGIVFVKDPSGRIYCPLGSILNCIGYIDNMEKHVGIARITMALFSMVNNDRRQMRLVAGAHIFRGILEMLGNHEGHLFILDSIATVGIIAYKFFKGKAAKLREYF